MGCWTPAWRCLITTMVPGPVTALSQSSDGTGGSHFAFSPQIRPVAYFAIEDLNGTAVTTLSC